jgi:TfoX/Sxy family transcriptional regulator of competence genes
MEMPYWRAPEMLFDDADAFREWAEAAFTAAVRARADRPAKGKSKAKKGG